MIKNRKFFMCFSINTTHSGRETNKERQGVDAKVRLGFHIRINKAGDPDGSPA
jgi:hypothetical protein